MTFASNLDRAIGGRYVEQVRTVMRRHSRLSPVTISQVRSEARLPLDMQGQVGAAVRMLLDDGTLALGYIGGNGWKIPVVFMNEEPLFNTNRERISE